MSQTMMPNSEQIVSPSNLDDSTRAPKIVHQSKSVEDAFEIAPVSANFLLDLGNERESRNYELNKTFTISQIDRDISGNHQLTLAEHFGYRSTSALFTTTGQTPSRLKNMDLQSYLTLSIESRTVTLFENKET